MTRVNIMIFAILIVFFVLLWAAFGYGLIGGDQFDWPSFVIFLFWCTTLWNVTATGFLFFLAGVGCIVGWLATWMGFSYIARKIHNAMR